MPRRVGLWLFVALLPALAIAGVRHHVKHERWTDDYDRYFRKYTKHYFGAHFDWHWFKAQAIAESALNPDACSPAGARGIMQILPATYQEIKAQNPFLANIAAGIFYDRQLSRKWKRKRDIRTAERLNFGFGSYNAGDGNVLKAYRRASAKHGEVYDWQDVAPYAPNETRHYVTRIQQLMAGGD